jgi:hypothetical protein
VTTGDPALIVLFFLYIGAIVAVIVAWFAILFTGRYPRGIFDYVEGVIRWHDLSSPTRTSSSPTTTRRSGCGREPATPPGVRERDVASRLPTGFVASHARYIGLRPLNRWPGARGRCARVRDRRGDDQPDLPSPRLPDDGPRADVQLVHASHGRRGRHFERRAANSRALTR